MKGVALKAVRSNITFTDTTATAWYVLPGVRHAFRADRDHTQQRDDAALRYAALAGRTIHLRVTSRPWSAATWRESMDGAAINPLPAYPAHLNREAMHLQDQHLADKVVFFGVDLHRPGGGYARFLKKDREVEKMAEQIGEVDRVVAGTGLNGRPARRGELEWLIDRSVALGCPSPATRPDMGVDWEKDDIAAFTDRAIWTIEPFGRTLQVTADVDDTQVVSHIRTVPFGRMKLPDFWPPWLSRTDRLGFPVEIAVTAYIQTPEETIRWVETSLMKVKNQIKHYQDHHERPTPDLHRADEHGVVVRDEVERGMTGLSTRADVWIRLAVAGSTPEEALDRAAQVKTLYAGKIEIESSYDQYGLALEFIPGNPKSTSAFRRTLPVTTLASGQPAVSHHVGHERGIYLGYTAQGHAKRPVFWDLHRAMEQRERGGLTLFAADPGYGKSSIVGRTIYDAALAGVHCVVLDPSGPLSRLCYLPELRDVSRHVDLMSAKPGILNPFGVIPDPIQENFVDDPEPLRAYDQAVKMAEAQRRVLTVDILTMFLPSQYAENTATFEVLTAAAREVGGHVLHTPHMVIGALLRQTGHAKTIGHILQDISDLPAAQLVFPYADTKERGAFEDANLTVISMNGLTVPTEGTDRKYWSQEEQFSVPLLHLAASYTHRSIYQRPRDERKLIATDEAWAVESVASGQALINKSARDSRKHNARILLASQGVKDLLSAGIANLVDSVFIGRTEDHDAQVAALNVLKVPTDAGYEDWLGNLSSHARGATGRSGSREMVFSDGEGGIEIMVVDLSDLPNHVRVALDTTASPQSAVKREALPVAS